MATVLAIQDGNMSASITDGKKVDVRGHRRVFVGAQGEGTGSPLGVVGIKAHFLGPNGAIAATFDLGAIDGGNFEFDGAQPDGTTDAWEIYTEFDTAADQLEVYYTRTSGGTANTSMVAVIAGK